MAKLQMLAHELDELEEELFTLDKVLAELLEKKERAREQGDLSENSEYENCLLEIDRVQKKMEDLDSMIRNAEILEHSQDSSSIGLGSVVGVRYLHNNRQKTFTIVGDFRGDCLQNKLSKTSPLGSALFGLKASVGKIVSFRDNENNTLQVEITHLA